MISTGASLPVTCSSPHCVSARNLGEAVRITHPTRQHFGAIISSNGLHRNRGHFSVHGSRCLPRTFQESRSMDIKIPETLDAWNAAGADYLPGLLGMRFRKVEADEVVATLEVSRALLAWHGYLHAGTVTSLADTCCGYGLCAAFRPAPVVSPPWSSRAT